MNVLNGVIVAAAVGLGLLVLGLGGRRVGDHPFCRRCGFDLFGKPDESTACPECGGDVARRRATVIGVRRRRRWAIALAAVILLPIFAGAGVLGWARYNDVDWQARKPVWYLQHEANGSDVPTRDAALIELLKRYQAGALSKSQIASLLRDGLNAQGDLARPWSPRWGDLIEYASSSHGELSEDQWHRYLHQSVADLFIPRTRSTFSRDMPVVMRLDLRGARVGATWRLSFTCKTLGLLVDGRDMLTEPPSGWWGTGLVSTPGGRGGTGFPQGIFRDLPDGKHHAQARLRVGIVNQLPQLRTPITDAGLAEYNNLEAQGALEKIEVRVPFDFELLPTGASAVRAVADPSLQQAVKDSLTIEQVRFIGRSAHFMVKCQHPPRDLSFKIYVREGEKEWPVGDVAFARDDNDSYGRWVTGMLPTESGLARDPFAGQLIASDTVDIVFRPDAKAATSSAQIAEYWDGSVEFKGIALNDPIRDALRRAEDSRRRIQRRTRQFPTTPPR
jgi:hypothetical protein